MCPGWRDKATAHHLPAPRQIPKESRGISGSPQAMAQGVCFPRASLSHPMLVTEQTPCLAQEEIKQPPLNSHSFGGGLTMPCTKNCSSYLGFFGASLTLIRCFCAAHRANPGSGGLHAPPGLGYPDGFPATSAVGWPMSRGFRELISHSFLWK